MNFTEETALFECAGNTLLGILAKPENPSDTGVVVIVGGPQYRAGSHRQFVLLSRSLASAGFAVLRFDYRGMGDSEGEQRTFENVSDDVGAGIDALKAHLPDVKKIVLWGLCDGASAALLYCQETLDVRVAGLCLLNPWVRSDVSLAQTQVKHYYSKRLREREFWLKLASGKVAIKALTGLLSNLRVAFSNQKGKSNLASIPNERIPFQTAMSNGWRTFKGKILLVLSGNDYTAKEFLECANNQPNWGNLLNQSNVERNELLSADHTFSNGQTRDMLEVATSQWLKTLAEASFDRAFEVPTQN